MVVDRLWTENTQSGWKIELKLFFDAALSDPASHQVKVQSLERGVTGECTIRLNDLLLVRDPANFLTHVIPHELAHILVAIQFSTGAGKQPPEHGGDWQEVVESISVDASSNAVPPGDWTATSSKLHKGSFLAKCGCECFEAYQAFPNTTKSKAKIKSGEISCFTCETPLEMVMRAHYPSQLLDELKYIQDSICR